jgi:hypothetical protein
MKENVGQWDRTLRIVVGTLLIIWGIQSGNWLGLLGLIPFATAMFRWCPAYCPLGISTK